jgi:hypothetical protein
MQEFEVSDYGRTVISVGLTVTGPASKPGGRAASFIDLTVPKPAVIANGHNDSAAAGTAPAFSGGKNIN